jgi:hypothetical protein
MVLQACEHACQKLFRKTFDKTLTKTLKKCRTKLIRNLISVARQFQPRMARKRTEYRHDHCTVTVTGVEITIEPDVIPVTVNVAAPFGVPVLTGGVLELELPHPTITAANAKVVKHIPNAHRRRGPLLACNIRVMPIARNAASAIETPYICHGIGF